MSLYPSLLKIPGLNGDPYGNLAVKGKENAEGLRHRYSFVVHLPFRALKGTHLDELLDWMRWGSETGVMWEMTAEELFRVVAWWERANPNAPAELYGIRPDEKRISFGWRAFWGKCRPVAYGAFRAIRCPCGKIYRASTFFCPRCGNESWRGRDCIRNIRGIGQYNLAIDAGGGSVAAVAYATRGKPRIGPSVAYLIPVAH